MLEALGAWGLRYMTQPADGDEFRNHWFAFPVELFLHDRDPDGPALSIELRTTGRPAIIEVSGGQVRTKSRPTSSTPDLVLDGPPRLILGLLSAYLTPAQAQDQGLKITATSPSCAASPWLGDFAPSRRPVASRSWRG